MTNFADRTIWAGDNIDNLQLLYGHSNRVKSNRKQEYLVAKLSGIGLVP